MNFNPNPDTIIKIDGITLCFAEHPFAPGMPYGQQGRAGTVYQLAAPNRSKIALKVFRQRYRTPSMVMLSERLARFANLNGLEVCKRTVLTPRRHVDLLRDNPDLTYGVLMPWVEGPTWMEVMLEKKSLSPIQCKALAYSFAETLSQMEENGVAHCDLSGPNVLLPILLRDSNNPIQLVDVEQLHGPGMDRPEFVTSGSSGYAHRSISSGIWASNADRFAGAVIIAEMLGWCDGKVRSSSYDEQYFATDELQRDCEKYNLLRSVVSKRWGQNAAGLLQRAWNSATLADCPTFGEWLLAIPSDETHDVINIQQDIISHYEIKEEITPRKLPNQNEAKEVSYKLMENEKKSVEKRPAPINGNRSSIPAWMLGIVSFMMICVGVVIVYNYLPLPVLTVTKSTPTVVFATIKVTGTPVATGVPEATEAPVVSESPVATEAPVAIESPIVSLPPLPFDSPKVEVYPVGDEVIIDDISKEKYPGEGWKSGTWSYITNLTANQRVFAYSNWCATDKKTLDENLQDINMSFHINSQKIPDEYIITYYNEFEDGRYCINWNIYFYDWFPGKYNFQIQLSVNTYINDEGSEWAKGDYIREYDITVYGNGTSIASSTPTIVPSESITDSSPTATRPPTSTPTAFESGAQTFATSVPSLVP